MLLGLFLLLGSILLQAIFTFQFDGTQGVEEQEDVWEEGLIHLGFYFFKVLVFHIETLNVRLRVDVLLRFLNKLATANVINEVEHNKRQTKPELYLVKDFCIDICLLAFVVVLTLATIDLIFIVHVRFVDKVANARLFLVFCFELLIALVAHLAKTLICDILPVGLGVICLISGHVDIDCTGSSHLTHDLLIRLLVRRTIATEKVTNVGSSCTFLICLAVSHCWGLCLIEEILILKFSTLFSLLLC